MEFYRSDSSPDEFYDRDTVDNLKDAVIMFQKQIQNINPINADSDSIQHLLNAFNDVLESGFKQNAHNTEFTHYWSAVSSILDTGAMRFVNSLEKFTTDNEKAYVWILIELYNKNLKGIFNIILENPEILKFYQAKSIIKGESKQVKEILSRLDNSDYRVESKFLKVYEENREDFEDASYTEDNSVFTHENANNQTGNWSNNLYEKRVGNNASESDSLSNSPDRNRKGQFKSPQSDKKLLHVSKVGSSPGKKATNVKEVKENLERYKTLLKRPTLKGRDDEEIVSFVREGYLEELEKKNLLYPLNQVNKMVMSGLKVLDPVQAVKKVGNLVTKTPKIEIEAPKKSHRKTSSAGDRESVWHDKKKSHWETNKGSQWHARESNWQARESAWQPNGDRRRSSFDGGVVYKGAKPALGHLTIPNIHGNTPSGDTTAPKEAIRHSMLRSMKNSQLLYIEKYQQLQTQSEFRAPPEKVLTAEDQAYKCFECGQNLNKLWLTVFPRKNYCQYTGYWYCNNCMAKEKLVIPWFVKENYDFKLYHVSRKAREEIKNFYDKPNILIDYKSRAVLDNQVFYDALVMKRQLHLIFDMICEANYVLDLFLANSNLLLKENLFSLKNLADIQSGAMTRYMDKNFAMLTGHIAGCSICQTKGRVCKICNDPQRLFPYDIKNTSVCRKCKSLYHSKCLKRKKCITCQHND